ncbi:MAG: hypothetical protein QFB87_04630 [Patescibacteria group bacterium]|nr:hypothetical protein [Patescibacteria group bacterium]
MGLVVKNNYLLLEAVKGGSSQFDVNDNKEHKYKVLALDGDVSGVKEGCAVYLIPNDYPTTTIQDVEYTLAKEEDVVGVEHVA